MSSAVEQNGNNNDTPVLRLDGGIDSALSAATLAALHGAPLAEFLSRRRWYGAKGQRTIDARFDAVIPVRAGSHGAAITRVAVELEDGRSASYQLPLIALPASDTGTPGDAVLARLQCDGADGMLVDATEDAAFRAWLGDALEGGRSVASGGVTWTAQPVAGTSPSAATSGAALPDSRVVASEQSNTSIAYGERSMLKLFRRLEAGVNPDVEISRFLTTRTDFRNTPALLGVAYIRNDADAEGAVAAMLQEFVAGAADAFGYALERAAADLAADSGEGTSFRRDAERLGAITRGLHAALASDPHDPDFAPSSAGREAVAGWTAATRKSIQKGCDLLARGIADRAVAPELLPLAQAVVARSGGVAEQLEALTAAVGDDAGMLIRHHGDYHLGQVLRSQDGDFMVIDFEGEPARSIPERRARSSGLRDVAGMLRSFAYAAAMAPLPADAPDPVDLSARRARWEEDVRAAFLRGYFGCSGASFLPRDRASSDAVVRLFELEKVFYELAYELNSRPALVGVPLAGVARCLVLTEGESGAKS